MPARLTSVLTFLATLFAATLGVVVFPTVAFANSQTTRTTIFCHTRLADIEQPWTVSVNDSADPVLPGSTLTYRFSIPFNQEDPGLRVVYHGGQTFIAIPAPLDVTDVRAGEPVGPFTSSVKVQNGNVVITTDGDQEIDGGNHPTPDIFVTARVAQSAPAQIAWKVASRVTANVTADGLGELDADCRPIDPNLVIATTAVPQNHAPVAKPQSVKTFVNRAITIRLTASDPDRDALELAIKAAPKRGTLSGVTADPPSVRYTPRNLFEGSDSFSYSVTDPKGRSVTAKVSINVQPLNVVDDTPPVIALDSPVYGAVYTPGEEIAADFSCSDTITPIIECNATKASGELVDTSAGAHTFVVSARDYNGNVSRRLVSYQVIDTTPVAQEYRGVAGDDTTRNMVPLTCANSVGPAPLSVQSLLGAVPIEVALAAAGVDPAALPFDPRAVQVVADASVITVPTQASSHSLPLVAAAPLKVAAGGSIEATLAIGEQSVPELTSSHDFTYTWAAPSGATVRSARFDDQTGTTPAVRSASVSVVDGRVTLRIAGPFDNSQGQEPVVFTPPVVHVTLDVATTPRQSLSMALASATRVDTVGALNQVMMCSAAQPAPELFHTTVVDTTPPAVTISSPTDGALYKPNQMLAVTWAATDADTALTAPATATAPDGSSISTGATTKAKPTARKTFTVSATDLDGNVTEVLVSYSVRK